MLLKSAMEIRSKLTELISDQKTNDPILVAVAYWGDGSQNIFPRNQQIRLLCKLADSTNPYVIQELRKRYPNFIKHNPRLHAKVAITTNGAIVSSANMSSNGLDLDKGKKGLHEIGVLIKSSAPEYVELKNRFWELWLDEESTSITSNDIDKAIQAWKNKEREQIGQLSAPKNDASGLSESIFFRTGEIDNDKQRIRMASHKIEKLLSDFHPNHRLQEKAKIAAFAANSMWTATGREIQNNLSPNYIFVDTSEVIGRARNIIGEKLLNVMIDFLTHLSNLPESTDTELTEIRNAAASAVKIIRA